MARLSQRDRERERERLSLVRDTTSRDGTVLDILAGAWEHFTAPLK